MCFALIVLGSRTANKKRSLYLSNLKSSVLLNETEDLGRLPHSSKDHSVRFSHPMVLNSYSNYIVCYTLGMCCDFNNKQCM